MATFDTTWYVNYGNGSSTGYFAVTTWVTGIAKVVGNFIRATAPAVGNERVFVCIVAGTTGGAQPTWVNTRGALTTDNTVTWQECTGQAALNGDLVNTQYWSQVSGQSVSLGQIVKDAAQSTYFICSTAGTSGGTEPTWNLTAGQTSVDNTVTWTSLGAVGNYTGWQAPHARLTNAFASTWGAAGNTFYINSASAETRASAMTLTSPGTFANPCRVLCVGSGHVPPQSTDLTTGATLTTTGASNLTWNGFAYLQGLTCQAGSGAVANGCHFNPSSAAGFTVVNCSLQKLGTTANTSAMIWGASTNTIRFHLELINTTVKFGNTGDGISMSSNGGDFIWRDTPSAIQGATIPTTLFSAISISQHPHFEGVDLSAITGNLVAASFNALGLYLFENCKFASATTVIAGPQSGPEYMRAMSLRSSSGQKPYQTDYYTPRGNDNVATTVYRIGGGLDGNMPVARNLNNLAASLYHPFAAMPLVVSNSRIGAVTITVFGLTSDANNAPKNDAIWLEAFYLGNASTPLGSSSSNRVANHWATPTSHPDDTASNWVGISGRRAFKMSLTITPRMVGPIAVIVKTATNLLTFHIDPSPVLS